MELTVSPQMANSCKLVLARISAPLSRSLLVAKASFCGTQPFSATLPAVVGMSVVLKLSFSITGMP